LNDAEHTNPPGIASTSTPNDASRRRSSDDDAGGVQREVGCIEEEDLAHPCVERIDVERLQRRGSGAVGDRELQLGRVGTAQEREELLQLVAAERRCVAHPIANPRWGILTLGREPGSRVPSDAA
jgi:hypothetical protein